MIEAFDIILRTVLNYSKKYSSHLLITSIVVLIAMYIWFHRTQIFTEGFTSDGWNLSSSTSMENAHGSAPAGVNALPGEPQYQQNSASPPVNPANKKGNPQNTQPEFKKQPLFAY